jgi:uncharacterized repeat protein (TIGR03803 family)
MNTRNFLRLTGLLSLMVFAIAHAQTYSVLMEFSGGNGQGPTGPLVLSGSSLYGTTYLGGNSNWGTIFTMTTNGSGFTVLRHFVGPTHTNGATPTGNLILSGNTLFGTTESGGQYTFGTVFRMSTNGSGYSVMHPFGIGNENSVRPRSGLLLLGTNVFGTTYGKPTPTGYGTVFRVSTNGSGFLALMDFNLMALPGDGRNPWTGLTVSGTNLFGTTYGGGTSGNGTIFRMGTNGAGFTNIKQFAGSDGANPRTPLLISGGTLYGMTMNGGSAGSGTIFKLSTNGTGFTTLKDFSGGDGANPLGNLLLAGHYLYGTTYAGGSFGLGTLFRIHTNGSSFAVIKEFSGPDGGNPFGGLLASGSTLFGTTGIGGASDKGLVFALNLAPVVTVNNPGGSVELSWNSAAGLEYQVQFKTALSQSTWNDLGSSIIAGGPATTATDSTSPDEQRFYRVLLLQ